MSNLIPIPKRLLCFAARLVLALGIACASPRAQAQLAITEVMSAPAEVQGERTDFWELTNFGTNIVDLTQFYFRDLGGFSGAKKLGELADPLTIAPGESIIFVQSQGIFTATPADFRQWWGEANLPVNLKIIFYLGYGFSRGGDALQLWEATATQTNLIDQIELFASIEGASFSYEPGIGALDTFSTAGVNGAFVAVTTPDVGSPGFTIGPVPLNFVDEPDTTEVDAGSPVTFSARAVGLPRPLYQWRFNGNPIAGATARTFSRTNTVVADAGQYSVLVSNGVEQKVSTPATLTVNTLPRCATIVKAPSSNNVTLDQTAIFHVEVRGFPLPAFRWQFNGVDIPNATNSTYSVVAFDSSVAGTYTVHVTNALCSTNVSAQLKVVPVPNLVITEAMANPSSNTVVHGHNDWWELTNMDTNAVNLRGYRFDDLPGDLENAFTITNDVIVPPGKSVIFVSTMSPAAFVRWWGAENLPVDLQIVSYFGNGFTPSGDLARLWNPTALDPDDWTVSQGIVNPDSGVSQWFDPVLAEFGVTNVLGELGAFRAAESDDIGSPGWISNEQRVVRPRITSIRPEPAGVALTWKTETNRTYEVQYRQKAGTGAWTPLVQLPATGASLTTVDTNAYATSNRFYQVILVPTP